MDKNELKHIIALLLEDAKRIQQLEPNAGTEARMLLAQKALAAVGTKSGLNGAEIIEALIKRRAEIEKLDSERLGRIASQGVQ